MSVKYWQSPQGLVPTHTHTQVQGRIPSLPFLWKRLVIVPETTDACGWSWQINHQNHIAQLFCRFSLSQFPQHLGVYIYIYTINNFRILLQHFNLNYNVMVWYECINTGPCKSVKKWRSVKPMADTLHLPTLNKYIRLKLCLNSMAALWEKRIMNILFLWTIGVIQSAILKWPVPAGLHSGVTVA